MNFTKMAGEQPTQQQTLNSLQTHDNESIRRTAKEIAEITNGKDDTEQKVQLEGILTTEFANKLDQPTASTLLTEAKAAKAAKEEKQETYTELDDLIDFLELIVKPHQVNGTLDITEGENQNSVIENFDNYFGTTGSLKDISLLPEESQNAIKNIEIALNNPTTENIQQLQNFLYNNLSDNEKDDFLKKNGKKVNDNITWDGKIGKCEKNASGEFTGSTAKALDDFLKNTADYVDKYTAHKEITNQGEQQQQKKIENVKATINTLNNTNTLTIQDIEQATNDYNTLSNGEKAQIDKATEKKLNEAKQTLNTLKNKMEGIKENIISILNTNNTSLEQKTYELTKLLKEKITPEEAQILLNSINGNQNGTITIRNLNIDNNNKEIFKQALTNITENKIPNQETEVQKQENIQAQIEQNNNASKSFDEISEELQKIGNAKINAILTQIAPLNEKLKQGHSINYLKAEESRLIQAIKNFGGEDTSFKENGKIESGLDKDEKKGFRKEIRDLEKQLMDVRKELEDKQKIKDKIYKNESGTGSGMITEIKNIISTNSNNDYYTGAIDSYINNLDNMGQDVEDKQKSANETTQGENTPEQTSQPSTPEKGQSSINRPTSVTRVSGLQQLFNIIKENLSGFERIKGRGLFGNLFALADSRGKNGQINLDKFSNEDIKSIMRTINNENRAFNGRQEIVNTINSGNKNQMKKLQEKLITLGGEEKSIKIDGNLDKGTTTALQNYIENQVTKTSQSIYNNMPYRFLEGYTKNTYYEESNKELYTKGNGAILITRNEDGFISTIEKGNLDENGNNISNSNKETRNITDGTVTEATNNENSSASTENGDQGGATPSTEAQVQATNSTGNQPTASETTNTPQSATQQ